MGGQGECATAIANARAARSMTSLSVQVGENSDTNRKDALVWLTPLGKQVVARVKEEAA